MIHEEKQMRSHVVKKVRAKVQDNLFKYDLYDKETEKMLCNLLNAYDMLLCEYANLRALPERIHDQNKIAGWWDKDEPISEQVPKKLLLVHSEISEACEAFRKNLKDDKLPHRDGLEVELADAVIRILDLAQACGYDMWATIEEKLIYNSQRADHKLENRLKHNGKKF